MEAAALQQLCWLPNIGQWHPSISSGLGHTPADGAFCHHHLVIQAWATAEKQVQERFHSMIQLKQRQ